MRIQKERREFFVNTYKRYKGSHPASQWNSFPHHSLLFHSSLLFKNLFHEPPSGNPRYKLWSLTDMESVIADELPTAVVNWRQKFRQEILSLLPYSLESERKDGLAPAFRDDMLNLATFVFSYRCPCTSRRTPRYGWDDILSHWSICNSPWGVRWSDIGQLAVKAILSCLKLDPWVTTPQDLDRINARFCCANDEPRMLKGGRLCKKALTWRECVSLFGPRLRTI